MFYIAPRSPAVAARWLAVANLDRLPVHNPQPYAGLWHVNAAAIPARSLQAIAAYLARQNKTTRTSWVQATEQMIAQIRETFPVKADDWQLVTPEPPPAAGVFHTWPIFSPLEWGEMMLWSA